MSASRLWLLILLLGASLSCGPASPRERPPVPKSGREKAEYHYKLATGLIYEKKPIAALRELTVSLGYDPEYAPSHYLVGFIYMGRRNYGEALVSLMRATALDPKLYEARNALTACYMAMHQWRKAIEAAQPLLDDPLNPSPWLTHNNVGWSYFQLKVQLKALHHLEMSVILNPKFCLGYYNRALVLESLRRWQRARVQLDQARKRCPKHAATRFELGKVYEQLLRPADARRAYRTCREIAEGGLLGERCRAREQAIGVPPGPRRR